MQTKQTIEQFRQRPLSWSSISSFEWDREEWYQKYIMGQQSIESVEMKFGKDFALSIEDGSCSVKDLMDNLETKKEHKFHVMFGEIPLVGFADAFCDKTFKKLNEVKTGKKEWDQKRVDEHRQIDMYLLMNFITNKVKPEDVECTLFWLPTKDNGDFSISFVEPITVHKFKTKRTMRDILVFSAYVRNIYVEMINFIHNHA